jgi:hypothetical protein
MLGPIRPLEITYKKEVVFGLLNTTSFLFNHNAQHIVATPSITWFLNSRAKLVNQEPNKWTVPFGG